MNGSSRPKAEEIFEQVASLTVAERSVYLDEHCRDATLRTEVEKLLRDDRVHPGSRTVDIVRAAPGAVPGESAPGRGDLPLPYPSRPAPAAAGFDHGRFLPGTVIAGRYRVVGLLGKGGMGEVYRADDLELHQSVALKFLPEQLATDPGALQRFRSEVRLARQLSHPNICRVHDIGHVDGLRFLSMEYVDGEDLASLLRRIHRFSEDRAIEIARQLCLAIAAAHEKGVVHRDLKPANVMIDGRGKVLVTDFGLAAYAESVQREDIRSGTPAYMAPEQLEGREVTERSDIYSLGLILHEVFTGRAIWEADTLGELFERRKQSSTPASAELTGSLDPAVARVIQQCLEVDPARRPASAIAIASALPGGDPLVAALARGETPSPEMVAAAGGEGALSFKTATSILLGAVFLLVLAFLLSDRAAFHRDAPPKHPEALAENARDVLEERMLYDPEASFAYGFEFASREREVGSPPYYYWYRQSPERLVPVIRIERTAFLQQMPRISENDPPGTLPGTVSVRLAPGGELLSIREGMAIEPESPSAARDDVSFLSPNEISGLVSWVLYYLVLAASVVLAVRNLRSGRGHVRGAFVVAGFTILVRFAYLQVRCPFAGGLEQFQLVLTGLAWSVFAGVTNWLLYVALEPYVRRAVPDAIISWTRLLDGRIRDPLVGRDLLVGAAVGVALLTPYKVFDLISGDPGLHRSILNIFAGGFQVFGSLLFVAHTAMQASFRFCFYFVLLLILVRRRWLAGLLLVFIYATLKYDAGTSLRFVFALYPVVATVVFVRFGLLSLVAMYFTSAALLVCPITLHVSAWFFGSGLIAGLVVLAILGYSWHTSLGQSAKRPQAVLPAT